MLGILPDLTPRDSHSVWYSSSRRPSRNPFIDFGPDFHPRLHPYDLSEGDNGGTNIRRRGQAVRERFPAVRLRADEQYMERRRMYMQNFGATWLKPPGVPKTLHQLREERREAEEHAEAMRREQLQQELAEAEAAGNDMDEGGDADDMGDGARDLDEDIPDASAMDMGMGDVSSDSSSDSSSVSSDETDEEERAERRREQRREELIREHMRMAHDTGDIYDIEEELEAESQGEILLEEVFRSARLVGDQAAAGDEEEDLNMDANLDDSIPEAGELSGVYEHTDSEAGMSSISGSSSMRSSGNQANRYDHDMDFGPRSSIGGVGAPPLRPPTSPTLQAARGDGSRGQRARRSMDISSLLSGGDSSALDSSPMRGPSRR